MYGYASGLALYGTNNTNLNPMMSQPMSFTPLGSGPAPGAATSQYQSSTPDSFVSLNLPSSFNSVTTQSPTLSRNFGSSASSATNGSNPGDDNGVSKGWFDRIGGGEGLGAILEGIGQLGSVWAAIQQNKIAKESLKFQKDAYKTNLANQTKSYNTALEGRAQLRFSQEGNLGAKDDYLNNNRL
jgi:hypothetical protein